MILALILAAAVTTNKVLMVNQEGQVNTPAALATTADMAAIKAATLTAEEKAAAAEAAAKAGTNMVAGIVADIGRNELVIYRYGYTDGLSAAQVLDADAKLVTSAFKPLNEQNAAGLSAFSVQYALKNSTEFSGQPIIRWRGALDDGTDFEPIDAANIEPVERIEPYTDGKGIVYQWHYKTKFFDQAAKSGFYLVTLLPDDSAGDGMAMELPNGVAGGATTTFEWDGHRLDIVGGVIVGVTEVTE